MSKPNAAFHCIPTFVKCYHILTEAHYTLKLGHFLLKLISPENEHQRPGIRPVGAVFTTNPKPRSADCRISEPCSIDDFNRVTVAISFHQQLSPTRTCSHLENLEMQLAI
jgi:hypothetical protein